MGISINKKSGIKVFNILNDFLKENKPKIFQTDNGSEFIYNKLTELLESLKISHILSSPYSPKSQGVIERFNRTIKQMIFKSITSTDNKQFIHILKELLENYNNSYH